MRQSHRLADIAAHLRVPVSVFVAASAAFLFAGEAQAVMRGQSAGGISRQQLLTANHCVESSGPFFVVAGGRKIPVTGHSASGQTTLITIASPLPASYVPIATGEAGGDGTFTIAGYGTAREAERMHSAGLREARLVTDPRYGALVDPRRRGPISASACMGDSGGPVAKFDGRRYVLVGIVERVSNYAGVGACGFLTHFSSVSGVPTYVAAPEGNTRQASEPREPRRSAGKKRNRWAAR